MKLNKFWIALTWFLAVAWINEAQAQVKNNTTQDLSENFSKNKYIIVNDDLPEKIESHEDFITTRIDKIFKLYWKEKALELINE